MAEKNDFLPQNIKSLRRAFGESQEDLAFAIGLEAKTTISNYENGTRRPKPEVRKKLAKHFRITEEQLINVDLSGIRKTSFNKMNDIHRIQEIGFAAFPVVCSEAAMKNTSFANGYNAHKRINECLHSGVKPDDKDYDIFIESYYSAWEKNAIPEAAGNILSWFLQIEYSVLNPQLSEGAQRLMDNKISGADYLSQYYLKDLSFENEEDNNETFHDKESVDSYNEMEEYVQGLLKELKSSRLSDLAYYYAAIRYIYGIVKNEFSEEMNQTIGCEMMWTICELGNKYAKDFLQVIYLNLQR